MKKLIVKNFSSKKQVQGVPHSVFLQNRCNAAERVYTSVIARGDVQCVTGVIIMMFAIDRTQPKTMF